MKFVLSMDKVQSTKGTMGLNPMQYNEILTYVISFERRFGVHHPKSLACLFT
jgi:hypothetical protein